MGILRIGDCLLENKAITKEQLDTALAIQKENGFKQKLGEILLDLNYVKEIDLLKSLSETLHIPILDLKNKKLSIDTVMKIPKKLAFEHGIIAVSEDEIKITIAIMDPLDSYAIEDVKSVVNKSVAIVLAPHKDILDAIEVLYKETDTKKAIEAISDTGRFYPGVKDAVNINSEEPIVKLINSLLLKAESVGASDIHIEPFDTFIRIRLRVDGDLVEYSTLPSNASNSISNRIKIMSGLDIGERRLPQDGHLITNLDSVSINIRVSIIPTVHGEKIVLRFLNSDTKIDSENQWGMNEHNFKLINRVLEKPHGLLYITGPTGSGKTTTLYMILKSMTNRKVNISTIEDPVEQEIKGVNQTSVNPLAGLTFGVGLRSLLRQDPDIVMIGETRDKETASIAVSAAMTGHLVLSTLHTNDAVNAVVRLKDMGIEPYLVADSMIGIVSQRLVKKICENCKVEYSLSEMESNLLGGMKTAFKGCGCAACNGSGYKGRIAVHEVLYIDKTIRTMISQNRDVDEISQHCHESGYVDLRKNVEDYIKLGTTTTEELARVLGSIY